MAKLYDIEIPYPCVVVADRYGGTYPELVGAVPKGSSAAWLAFNVYPQQIPEEVFGDDIDCHEFWVSYAVEGYDCYAWLVIGMGTAPELAIEDLIKKLQEKGKVN